MNLRRGRAWLAAFAVVCASLVVPIATAPPAAAAGNRAVVVVDTGTSVTTRVIEFSGSVSGIDALELAGVSPVTVDYGGGLGSAVCSLLGVPSQWSECPGGWSYYRSTGGASSWGFSPLGASNTAVHDGDVEGWKYGGGRPSASASFCSYVACAPPPTEAPPANPGASQGTGSTNNGTAGTSVGGASTAGGGTNTSGTGAATNGDPATEGSTSATDSGSSSSTTSTTRAGTTKHTDTEEAALASSKGTTGTSGGSGSPIGIAAVVVLLLIAGTVAMVVRRRRRAASA
ncbi:MAG: hypothetical protein ABWY80_06670 [Acidimicrobiia bacterium]